jgi:hypothetical protein
MRGYGTHRLNTLDRRGRQHSLGAAHELNGSFVWSEYTNYLDLWTPARVHSASEKIWFKRENGIEHHASRNSVRCGGGRLG